MMKALLLTRSTPVESRSLRLVDLPVPQAGTGEVLVRVSACGICHTELDEIEGRLPIKFPIIPGHEIVGRVVETGKGVTKHKVGDRVGIAWIHDACTKCEFCRVGLENLCPGFKATGCDVNGGYAEYAVINEGYTYPIPEAFSDTGAAPLLCAGAIGYRDLRLTNLKAGQILGLFGFGASAYIVLQLARHQNLAVFVFTRGEEHRQLALKLGAAWVGRADEAPPQRLHAAIDFTPVGETVPQALGVMEKGGRLVIAVIRKRNPIPSLDYGRLLWEEREIKSVANITRKDLLEFLPLAAQIPITTEVQEFSLADANEALLQLKQGKIRGAAVLRLE